VNQLSSPRKGVPALKKLYVGNLPYQASEADLENFFSQAGVTVDSVNLMRDRFSGEARGFGFVQVADEDMDRAISACNGKQFMGRPMVVNEARPAREGGGGRGAGGGGGERRGGGGGRGERRGGSGGGGGWR
jgi:cold-inducible RNA-binding protein